MFISVSGLPFVSVSVALPFSSEPPAIAILAEVFVSETSVNVGFDDGKSAPTWTFSEMPSTEIFAVVGLATATGGLAGLAGAKLPPSDGSAAGALDFFDGRDGEVDVEVEPDPEPESEPAVIAEFVPDEVDDEDDEPADREPVTVSVGASRDMADTAALLRELSSLGLDDDPPAAPTAPAPRAPSRPPVSAPSPAKKKKRGLFGL